MVNNEHAELNEELVCKHQCDVTDKDAAWILLQEPGFIGFGAVYKDKICWPQHAEPLDWTRVRDLRLFGEKVNGTFGRIGTEVGKAVCGNWRIFDDALTEYHVLWGAWPPKPDQSPWIKLTETRGTEIWLPIADSALKKSDFPLRIKLKQVIGYDDNGDNSSHLAGIIDAVLVALVNRTCKKTFYPSPLPDVEPNKVEAETSCSNGDASAASS